MHGKCTLYIQSMGYFMLWFDSSSDLPISAYGVESLVQCECLFLPRTLLGSRLIVCLPGSSRSTYPPADNHAMTSTPTLSYVRTWTKQRAVFGWSHLRRVSSMPAAVTYLDSLSLNVLHWTDLHSTAIIATVNA